MVTFILGIILAFACNIDALILPERRPLPIQSRLRKSTSLHGWNNNNNNGDDNNLISNFFTKASQSINNDESSSTLITPQMEEEVMASARATMDENAVSRAVSSLIDDDRIRDVATDTMNGSSINTVVGLNSRRTNSSSSNKLRDLAAGNNVNGKQQNNLNSISTNNTNNNNKLIQTNDSESTSWNTQQIAIASGITVTILSPVIIPIIHVLLPPIIPSPSSLSFTSALLLGAISYIIALGDPTTDQSNIIGGESVEVGGAVSRIVGRTALQTAKASAPRVRAVARAALDYDATTATLEDLQSRVDYLSQKTLELDDMNQKLRYEVALFTAVEDIGSQYKLEELKELARYNGVRGYSTESKNGLLRKLVKEQVLELDLTPYYERVSDRL